MGNWEKIFGSYLNSAVFNLARRRSYDGIRKAAASRGVSFVEIDLKGVSDKLGFLDAVAEALNFPSSFGRNWDALSDFLGDLSWLPSPGMVILFTSFNALPLGETDNKILREILDSSVQYWKARMVPFFVLLS